MTAKLALNFSASGIKRSFKGLKFNLDNPGGTLIKKIAAILLYYPMLTYPLSTYSSFMSESFDCIFHAMLDIMGWRGRSKPLFREF